LCDSHCHFLQIINDVSARIGALPTCIEGRAAG
jgi:hypothetical protein